MGAACGVSVTVVVMMMRRLYARSKNLLSNKLAATSIQRKSRTSIWVPNDKMLPGGNGEAGGRRACSVSAELSS